ncbi:hypothetical protein B0H15DRAFT_957308 [Mycena belliarum]|uniref:Uncharacterized protein n=1 Tax=Mycena belliarum TaxID=1033014 RepID=A0AAD6XLP0_9AGAR|nr:hypothetical protein B0H15DRAFT_957303 [Mycena belliae]KAJ7073322.1 hypothetical protein B0H15DRAFT_957308 [Mycena belliae]
MYLRTLHPATRPRRCSTSHASTPPRSAALIDAAAFAHGRRQSAVLDIAPARTHNAATFAYPPPPCRARRIARDSAGRYASAAPSCRHVPAAAAPRAARLHDDEPPGSRLHTSRPPSRNAAARELGLAASGSELGFALEAPKPSASSPVARSARSHWRAKDGPARNRRPGRKSRGRSVRAVCPSASHRQYAGSSPRRRAASSLRALSTAARSLGARAVRDGTSGIPHHHLRYATLHYTRAAAGLYSDVAPRSPPSTRSSAHSRPLRRPHIAPPAGIPSRSGRPDCVRVHSRPRQVGPLVPPSPPPSPPRTQRRPRIRGPTCERGSDRGPWHRGCHVTTTAER